VAYRGLFSCEWGQVGVSQMDLMMCLRGDWLWLSEVGHESGHQAAWLFSMCHPSSGRLLQTQAAVCSREQVEISKALWGLVWNWTLISPIVWTRMLSSERFPYSHSMSLLTEHCHIWPSWWPGEEWWVAAPFHRCGLKPRTSMIHRRQRRQELGDPAAGLRDWKKTPSYFPRDKSLFKFKADFEGTRM
jgi:hypothetical protein